MEDIAKEQLDSHLKFVARLEEINIKGKHEMEEFLKLLSTNFYSLYLRHSIQF